MAVCSFVVPCRRCYKYRMSRYLGFCFSVFVSITSSKGSVRANYPLLIPNLLRSIPSTWLAVLQKLSLPNGPNWPETKSDGAGSLTARRHLELRCSRRWEDWYTDVSQCYAAMLCMLRGNRTRLTSQTTKECSRKS